MAKTFDVASAPYGEICAVSGEVWEVKDKENRIEIVIVDDSGTLIATFFDHFELARQFERGSKVLVRGKVGIFSGLKQMTNPQIYDFEDGILPEDNVQFSLPSVEERRAILANYLDAPSDIHGVTFVRARDHFGDVAECIKSYAEDGKEIVIVCPLAYKSKDERNALVPNYEKNHTMPELKYYPDICIDVDADCDCATKEALNKRFKFYRTLTSFGAIHTVSNVWKPTDVLIIEDADRMSILEIDKMRKRANCRTFVVSNSPRKEQMNRLRVLESTSDLNTLLSAELSFRRPGELLRLANA